MSPKYYSTTDLNCHFSVTGTQVPHFYNHLYANSGLNLYYKTYTSHSSSQLKQFQLLLIAVLNIFLLICLAAHVLEACN